MMSIADSSAPMQVLPGGRDSGKGADESALLDNALGLSRPPLGSSTTSRIVEVVPCPSV